MLAVADSSSTAARLFCDQGSGFKPKKLFEGSEKDHCDEPRSASSPLFVRPLKNRKDGGSCGPMAQTA